MVIAFHRMVIDAERKGFHNSFLSLNIAQLKVKTKAFCKYNVFLCKIKVIGGKNDEWN